MNAIELLKQQHVKVNRALAQMSESERIDPMELRMVADELVAHMVIEEHVFYPRVRELASTRIDESFEEHAVVRFELARALIASGPEQHARISVLKELVLTHIREEEGQLLTMARKEVPAEELDRLGTRMQSMFEKAVEKGFEALVRSEPQAARAPTRRPQPQAQAQARGGRARQPSRQQQKPAARGRTASSGRQATR